MVKTLLVLLIVVVSVSCSDTKVEKEYYSNGQLKVVMSYDKDGRKHGEYQVYYENGTLKEQGRFNKGIQDGKKSIYFPNGRKEKEWYYKLGVFDGPCYDFDTSGRLTAKGFFLRNKQHDTTIYYHHNGRIRAIEVYSEGERKGHWQDYYPNGRLKSEYLFRSDSVMFIREFDSLSGKEVYQYRFIKVQLDKEVYSLKDSVKATILYEGPVPTASIYFAYIVTSGRIEGTDEFEKINNRTNGGKYYVVEGKDMVYPVIRFKPKYKGVNTLILNMGFFDRDSTSTRTEAKMMWGGEKFYVRY